MPNDLTLSSGLDLQRLNELACLLEAAGDDGAIISLRRSDCILLKLKPGDPSATVAEDWVDIEKSYIEIDKMDKDRKAVVRKSKASILRVEAVVGGNGVIRTCNVHVGTARESLYMLRGGETSIEGRRQPDIQAPRPDPVGQL